MNRKRAATILRSYDLALVDKLHTGSAQPSELPEIEANYQAQRERLLSLLMSVGRATT